jgi:hypothetical protein
MIPAASSMVVEGSTVVGSSLIMSFAVEANAFFRRSSHLRSGSRKTVPPKRFT